MDSTITGGDPSPNVAEVIPEGRLVSIDALRGFDMIWITGLEELVKALCAALPSGLSAVIADQLEHRAWVGFAFYDLIFPLFVFLAGISLVFSLGRICSGGGRGAAVLRVVRRTAILYLLGVISYGGISKGLEHVRWVGVLQRIALSYCGASLLFLAFRGRWKPLLAVCVLILLGYWGLFALVPVPGGGPDPFVEGSNWANYLDQHYLPGRRWDGQWDPEGILSGLPAVSSCLLGVLAGLFLRARALKPSTRVAALVGVGAVLVALGYLWGLQFPVIKKLWSPSYVLVAGGFSSILTGLFYLVIDVAHVRAWTTPFLWVGRNAIVAYMAWNVVPYEALAQRLVGGPIAGSLGAWGTVLVTGTALGLGMSLLAFLHRRGIFLRV